MKTFMGPSYFNAVNKASKCRLAVSHNRDYVTKYLKYFSERETYSAFELRRDITPNPPDLRIGLSQLLYSIRARMGDVSRTSNLSEYIDAANGVNRGVDGHGSTMVSFMSNAVLPELLVAKRVGIFVNREEVPTTLTKKAPWPYLTVVPTEDIYNLSYDSNNELNGVILRTTVMKEEDGFPVSTSYVIDKFKLEDNKLTHTQYTPEGATIKTVESDMDALPFALLSIEESPVEDALDLHDSLLQLSSTDFIFLFKSNHPIYVEQYSVKNEMQKRQQERFQEKGRTDDSEQANTQIDVGAVTGRRYGENLDAPSFISPSVDHLQASEMKQEKIAKQIERMLTIESFNKGYKSASMESKREDKEPLIGNIQRLFDVLEKGEKDIAHAWHSYYNVPSVFTVEYPSTFDLRSEEARLASAETKLKLRDDVPSRDLKDTLSIEAVKDLLPTASLADIRKISAQIKSAQLNVSMSSLVRLIAENAIHPEHAITALGLDPIEAKRVIDFTREKLEFIRATQTGVANLPGADPTKPRENNDSD